MQIMQYIASDTLSVCARTGFGAEYLETVEDRGSVSRQLGIPVLKLTANQKMP